MNLSPNNATLNAGVHPDEDICGRIAHELGHMLGLNGISVDCFSVMHSSKADGSRDWNIVTAQDVYAVNRNLDDTTRLNGFCKPPQNLSDDPASEGGGDPGGGCGSDPCCSDPECCGDPSCGDQWCSWICEYNCSRYCDDFDEFDHCNPGGWSPWECEYGDCHQECY
jgi:hypothetical protein